MDLMELDLVKAALLLVVALALLFVPEWIARRAQWQHEEQLADRLAAGKDRYFEELRALEAYPPSPPTSPAWRVAGAVVGTLAIFNIYAQLTD